ncbi:MAG: alpha/beta fold hydrolase [Planctomycetota bacterium]
MNHLARLLAPFALAACATSGRPAEQPLAHPVEHTVNAADGTRIVYDVRGYAPRAGKTTLVFVHCWAGSRAFWKDELDRFADRYTVIALDLPGHGASGDRAPEHALAALGADVATVVNDARVERVILIGHSMGGPVSLDAAARLPGKVIGVIGIDTLHDADRKLPKDAIEGLANGFEQDFDGMLEQALGAMLPADGDPAAREWIAAEVRRAHRAPVIALLRAFVDVDLPALMRGARVPVRCINKTPLSSQDIDTAVDTNRKYCDFDVVKMEGVGHYPMIEQPEEFHAVLEQVVTELDRRP